MGRKSGVRRVEIWFSEAFKLAIVTEVEDCDLPFEAVRRKYGIKW
jgi:hypothetical protein